MFIYNIVLKYNEMFDKIVVKLYMRCTYDAL